MGILASSACYVPSQFFVGESAGYYSQLAGVLAALTLTGLTLSRIDSRYRIRGARALITAFVGLITASAMWAVIAGTDEGYTRAEFMSVSAVALTGIDTLLLGLALALILDGPEPRKTAVLGFRALVFVAGLMTWATAGNAFDSATSGGTWAPGFSWAPLYAMGLVGLTYLPLLPWRQTFRERAQSSAIGSLVALGVLMFIGLGVLAGQPRDSTDFLQGAYCGQPWTALPTGLLLATVAPLLAVLMSTAWLSFLLPGERGPQRAQGTPDAPSASG